MKLAGQVAAVLLLAAIIFRVLIRAKNTSTTLSKDSFEKNESKLNDPSFFHWLETFGAVLSIKQNQDFSKSLVWLIALVIIWLICKG